MVKELNLLAENKQELKLKIAELTRELKESLGKVDSLEGEREEMRKACN